MLVEEVGRVTMRHFQDVYYEIQAVRVLALQGVVMMCICPSLERQGFGEFMGKTPKRG